MNKGSPTSWATIFADQRFTSRVLNRWCLALLLAMGGNLAYAYSWLEIPPSLDPLVVILLVQMGGGVVYFVGRQVMAGQQRRLMDWGNQDEK